MPYDRSTFRILGFPPANPIFRVGSDTPPPSNYSVKTYFRLSYQYVELWQMEKITNNRPQKGRSLVGMLKDVSCIPQTRDSAHSVSNVVQ